MRIAIFGKYFKEEKFSEIQEFFEKLQHKNIFFSVYRKYYDDCIRNGLNLPTNLPQFNNHEEFVEGNFDYLFSIGGDGTILNCVEIMLDMVLRLLECIFLLGFQEIHTPWLSIDLGLPPGLHTEQQVGDLDAVFERKQSVAQIESSAWNYSKRLQILSARYFF